ncbi:hypothetical protein D3C80_1901820 [compost metagenome]
MKRRISPLLGSAQSIWLLPMPAKSPALLESPSVWIHSRPPLSKPRPSGLLNIFCGLMLDDPAFGVPACTVGLPATTNRSQSKLMEA